MYMLGSHIYDKNSFFAWQTSSYDITYCYFVILGKILVAYDIQGQTDGSLCCSIRKTSSDRYVKYKSRIVYVIT